MKFFNRVRFACATTANRVRAYSSSGGVYAASSPLAFFGTSGSARANSRIAVAAAALRVVDTNVCTLCAATWRGIVRTSLPGKETASRSPPNAGPALTRRFSTRPCSQRSRCHTRPREPSAPNNDFCVPGDSTRSSKM